MEFIVERNVVHGNWRIKMGMTFDNRVFCVATKLLTKEQITRQFHDDADIEFQYYQFLGELESK